MDLPDERRPPLSRPKLLTIASLPLLLAATNCCGSSCDDEIDKAAECNIPLTADREAALDECSEVTECEASCAGNKSCGAFTGDKPDEAAQYLACLDQCGGGATE